MRMGFLAIVALSAAALMTLRWETTAPSSFETEIQHAALTSELQRAPDNCPLSDEAIAREQAWVLAACLSGGLGWHEAAHRYGDDAANVFHIYGAEDEFGAIFERYGHPVVPVIAYFVRNGSTQYLLGETFSQGMSRLWNEGRIGVGFADLSPEQYGLIAVHELGRRGHEMLAEFEIVDGIAARKPMTRMMLGAKDLVFGGASDLETVLVRGERLPSWSEVGWATLDATIVVGGFGAAAKMLQAARLPTMAAARGAGRVAYLRAAGSGAARSIAAVGRAAGVAAAVAIPYVAITRPHLVASAGGWLAEQAGLPRWAGAFAVYSTMLLIVAFLAKLFLGPLFSLLRAVTRMVARPRATSH